MEKYTQLSYYSGKNTQLNYYNGKNIHGSAVLG